MFVYLSFSGPRIELPTAVKRGPEPDESPEVTFLDADGRAVARFKRADVAVHSLVDLGPSLPEEEDGKGT